MKPSNLHTSHTKEEALINQTALKEANLRRVLEFVKVRKETIKSELSRELCLSFSTVSALCSILEASKFIVSSESEVSSGGRKPARIQFNPEARRMLAIDISHEREACITLLNLDCSIVGTRTLPIEHIDSLEILLERISSACSDLEQACGCIPGDILGAAAAVPGVFDRKREIMISSTNPLLLNVKLKDRFERRLACPVWIENDSNMAALGEVISAPPQTANFLFLYASTGIGLGIVVDRKIYQGTTGYAGEFGHLRVTDRPIVCGCGQMGCLEAALSVPQLIESLWPGTYNLDDISRQRDVLLNRVISEAGGGGTGSGGGAAALLEEFAAILGSSIGLLVDLFNPDAIAVGGDIEPILHYLFPRIIAQARERSSVLRETDADIYIVEQVGKLIAKGCGETVYSRWLDHTKLLEL